MPRPVCVPCGREMMWVKPVVVQLNAVAIGGAYQQWHGDLARCGNCGAEIVARFAEQAAWHHFQPRDDAERPYVICDEVLGHA